MRAVAVTFLAIVTTLVPADFFGRDGGLPTHPEPMQPLLIDLQYDARQLAIHDRALTDQAASIFQSARWLAGRLTQAEPADYRLQLTIDRYLLESALKHAADEREIVDSVAQDLFIKYTDCSKHGHGRLVPVEIRTLKDGSDSSGWTIYYEWLPPTNGFQVSQLSFPQPSSPTSIELPPGLYQMHASKTDPKGAELKSETVKVAVGDSAKVLWKLPVP